VCLFLASEKGFVDVVKRLIQNTDFEEIGQHLSPPLINEMDERGFTPLMRASLKGHLGVVQG